MTGVLTLGIVAVALACLGAADAFGEGATPPEIVPVGPGDTLLAAGWRLQNVMRVTEPAEAISSPEFDANAWLPACVPGTVLSSYLAAGKVPDPYYADQQSQIDDSFFTDHDFWYRTSFRIAPECRGRRLRVCFDGINWKADVYFNGTKLGNIEGAFIRGQFDVTSAARFDRTNVLAVLVHRVAHPGKPRRKQLGRQYPNGGELGLDSPTFLASIGWNWLPTIPGRNTGIWNDVHFKTTGDLELVDPWITAEVSPANDRADLAFRTEIRNHSERAETCVLNCSMEGQSFRQGLRLEPHEIRPVTLAPAQWPALALAHPQLWWPNGYGPQNRYRMNARLEQAGLTSDERTVSFGVRRLECRTQDGALKVWVNGCPILCRGGNWGMDEGLLRCDTAGYDLRVRLHRDANLVMIRNWVGMTGKEAFYDACDRYGLLVWDDFWLANPSDGPDPADQAMFLGNARDKIRQVRGHPCLALYCGRNEGNPPPDLDAGLREAVAALDGTRFYLSHSATGVVTGFGPYDVQDPQWYFAHRGSTFHSELGIVCVPSVESLRAMMPQEKLWPINDLWAVHDYQTPRAPRYTQRITERYGAAVSVEDYCRKAQMVNFETGKAMYECLQSRQGGGLLVWMTQPAWPSLICQLYDYFFEPTAAYFGAKHACEPVHVLWDPNARCVKVANDTPAALEAVSAEARIFDLRGREQWHRAASLDVSAASARECFPLDRPTNLHGVFFVKLRLTRGSQMLSENFYWSANEAGNCLALNDLTAVALTVAAKLDRGPDGLTVSATVSNPSPAVALAIRLKLVRSGSGERVLPATYQDNYFSLLPGESRIVRIGFDRQAAAGEATRLAVEGWNIKPAEVAVESND